MRSDSVGALSCRPDDELVEHGGDSKGLRSIDSLWSVILAKVFLQYACSHEPNHTRRSSEEQYAEIHHIQRQLQC
jgi:hypothetical protein